MIVLWLSGLIIDRIGFTPVFIDAGIGILVVVGVFALLVGGCPAAI